MKLSHCSAVFVAAEDRQHPLLIQPDVLRKTNHGIGDIRIDLLVFRFTDTPGTKVPGVFCITGIYLKRLIHYIPFFSRHGTIDYLRNLIVQ